MAPISNDLRTSLDNLKTLIGRAETKLARMPAWPYASVGLFDRFDEDTHQFGADGVLFCHSDDGECRLAIGHEDGDGTPIFDRFLTDCKIADMLIAVGEISGLLVEVDGEEETVTKMVDDAACKLEQELQD